MDKLNDSINASKYFSDVQFTLAPKQWSKWLSLAKYRYNTTYHYDLEWAPFEAFIVLACVGNVAYELDLPPVHVSQLTLHVPSRTLVISELMLQTEASITQQLHPVAVLNHILLLQGTLAQPQVLMQWNALPRYMSDMGVSSLGVWVVSKGASLGTS